MKAVTRFVGVPICDSDRLSQISSRRNLQLELYVHHKNRSDISYENLYKIQYPSNKTIEILPKAKSCSHQK